jgi:hypothetical protein
MSDYVTFPVLSDEQIEALRPHLTEGIYDFECIASELTQSPYGGMQFALQLKVWDSSGTEYLVRDWIGIDEKSAWKLKAYFNSVGHPEIYKKGAARAVDLSGKSGKVEIYIQKKDERNYPKVKNYILGEANVKKSVFEKMPKVSGIDPDLNDDVPF